MTTATLPFPDEGRSLRDAALAWHDSRRSVYVRRGQRALLRALLEHGTATADDVRAGVILPPEVNAVCLGAVPTPLARAGLIVRRGYVPTGRPAAHARPVAVWELRDRDAAIHWLAEHPDIPNDATPADDAAGAAEHGG